MQNTIFQFRGFLGVPVEVQSSLIFLIGLLFVLSGSLLFTAIFAAALMLSIYLHELGHAWGAKVQGVPVRRIVLYGGGGWCEQTRSASARETEFIVAMGPIVNLVIWAVLSLAPWVLPGSFWATPWAFALPLIAQLNLFLALYNLLPLQPLDGGKLFQLGLARVLPALTATRIAGAVGLIAVLGWVPMMIWAYISYGFIFLYFPNIRLHWQMFRAGR